MAHVLIQHGGAATGRSNPSRRDGVQTEGGIEHGSQNDYEGDYSSVAFFYQTDPYAPFPPFPSDPAQLLPLGTAGP